MKDNFETALKHVLKHEGGFVNHPSDPGGMTNLGVTKKVWDKYVGYTSTESEMRALTPEAVAPLYRSQYWGTIGDELPSGMDYLYFDASVNMGPGRAAKLLQRTLGVAEDGAIGPKTMAALKAADPVELATKFSEVKEAFYKSLPTFPTFGKGWMRRVAESAEVAKTMFA